MTDRAPDPGDARRGPPAVDRGPTRPLTSRAERLRDRASETDRKARFRERVEQVERSRARRERRQRIVEVVTDVAIVVVLTVALAWGATLVDRPLGTGATVGLVVGLVAVALRRWANRYAASRGATAWDWQRGRHVVHGDPSKDVQSMTDGDDLTSRFTR